MTYKKPPLTSAESVHTLLRHVLHTQKTGRSRSLLSPAIRLRIYKHQPVQKRISHNFAGCAESDSWPRKRRIINIPFITSPKSLNTIFDAMEQTLFSTDLIPQTIASSLPSGYTLRPLQSGDYDRGVLDVLAVLTTVGEISKQKYLGNPPLAPEHD